MNYQQPLRLPPHFQEIWSATEAIDFPMASEPLVGALLRTLAASKPGGNFLELGTGTGLSTAWLLDGMDLASRLISVECDRNVIAIAQGFLGHDPRLRLHREDAGAFLEALGQGQPKFDLIFADTWAGKYTHLDITLGLLKPGGLYVIDDMLPQSNWPPGHESKVAALVEELGSRGDLMLTQLDWASGIMIATRVSNPDAPLSSQPVKAEIGLT
jgi:predicted O-methyltransferase YrrM